MCVCVCVRVSVCLFVCVSMCLFVCLFVCVYMDPAHKFITPDARTHKYTHAHIPILWHACMYASHRIHIRIHAYASMHTRMHAHEYNDWFIRSSIACTRAFTHASRTLIRRMHAHVS